MSEQPSIYHENANVRHFSDMSDEVLEDKMLHYIRVEKSEPMPRAQAMARRILEHLWFEAAWRESDKQPMDPWDRLTARIASERHDPTH